MRFGRKSGSSGVAKERLKLVLIHDRAGTSPSSDLIAKMKREILAVINKYFEVSESDFDVEIKSSSNANKASGETRLTANVPIRSVRNLGRNIY
ncbi:MAG: cell division topological specificity factor MinE [Burkholderiales bacterium]